MDNALMRSRLKECRVKKNMTQRDLAERLNITSAAVSAYEIGAAAPPMEILYELSSIFDVHSDYLLGIDDKKWLPADGLTDGQFALLDKIASVFKEDNCL